MGQLWVISVTGSIPHSACYFDYSGVVYKDGWLGFAPAKRRRLYAPGKIFTDDEDHRINHGIIFDVPDTLLEEAATKVKRMYVDKSYIAGIRDCVSFSADVARLCGLNVPDGPIMLPYELLMLLAAWNKSVEWW
jgi:hypothetical protein